MQPNNSAAPIPEKFLKPYNPQDTEPTIYKKWEESGFFNPDVCVEKGATAADAPAFSIVLPPPNVTGTLHVGHAAMLAIEDSLVRFERMRGKRTLWLPGTDHAAIATQSRVEKNLEKEKIRKHDLGREKFLERVHQFAQESHDTITTQIRGMGASVDWSREAYTLDDARSLAVRTAFKKMHDDGLIYRGHRIVNWDPKGQTTISDDEIVYTEAQTTLYTFRYAKDFPIPIATTRPETKVGDTAVAVHPEGKFKQFVGKEYDIDFAGEKIHLKIVADAAVDQAFGTGAVGVTPAHSQTDWEIAQRHKLPTKQIIDEFGKMTVQSPLLAGKKVADARATVVDWLRENNLLEKEETITHNIATAERSGGIIEPLPKLQWFIAVNKEFTRDGAPTTLKKIMHDAVASGKIKIIPDRFEKIYFNWIENLHDWCISRQIWFGHRIPVWYRGERDGKSNEEIYCDIEPPTGDGWTQDPDTLDTWFSSGLWTFSTLGWPNEEAPDFKTYHPTNLLETGYDILPFWVARMILMSGYLLGDIPFKTVYLHGLVRDGKGRKMSKSLGNIIDPLDMIKKYGADAVRLSLLIGTGPGNDSKLSEDKIRGYKNFANKIWNATRFVLENTTAVSLGQRPPLSEKNAADLEAFKTFSADITADIEHYRLYLAAEKLYHYFWHTFADVIIEESKKAITSEDETAAASARWTLAYLLSALLKLLHPFMPFVTEAIWESLPENIKNTDTKHSLLIITPWPSH